LAPFLQQGLTVQLLSIKTVLWVKHVFSFIQMCVSEVKIFSSKIEKGRKMQLSIDDVTGKNGCLVSIFHICIAWSKNLNCALHGPSHLRYQFFFFSIHALKSF